MDYSSVALVQTEPDAPKMAAVRVPDTVEPGDAVALQLAEHRGHDEWWISHRVVIGVVKTVFKDELAEEVAKKMTPGGEIPAATAIWKRIETDAPAGETQEWQGMPPAEVAERVVAVRSLQFAQDAAAEGFT